MRTTMRTTRTTCVVALSTIVVAASACSSGGAPGASTPGNPLPRQLPADPTGVDLVPPGYGSLRQDDIAVKVQLPSALVRAIPLDESIIRLLSPDSYRALREIKEGKRDAVAALASRNGGRAPSLWYISFYGLEPDTRFNATDVVIASAGRDYRPLDYVPLSTGFGDQRLRQRETQSALYLFDDALNANQPLTVTISGVQNATWDATLRLIERERSLVRSRAKVAAPPR